MRFLITRIAPITYGVLCPFYAKFRLEAQEVIEMLKERELYDEVERGDVNPSGRQLSQNPVGKRKTEELNRINEDQSKLLAEARKLDITPEAQRGPGTSESPKGP